MFNRKIRQNIWISRILLILSGFLAVYMLVGFGRLFRVYQHQRRELEQIEQKIQAAREEQTQLQSLLEYAQSDAAAEEWARQNGMAKSGEIPVVIIAPSVDLEPQQSQRMPGGVPASPREMWWELFFGKHSPEF